MHSLELSKHWQGLTHAERVKWLGKLHTLEYCLTAESLDISPQELDTVAFEAGLKGVRKTVVDVAGMRDWEHGVAGEKLAQLMAPRKLQKIS